MKFIFPQNYNLNTKILGIIEYSSAIVDLIWAILIFTLESLFLKSISIKIFLFIILVFPVLIFSIVGVNGENLIYYLNYMLKYFVKQKIYLYEK